MLTFIQLQGQHKRNSRHTGSKALKKFKKTSNPSPDPLGLYTNPSETNPSKKEQDKCPYDVKKKKKTNGVVVIKGEKRKMFHYESEEARIEKKEHTIKFDIVHLEEVNLEIPAFKQFQNNRTNFTEEGKEEFDEFIKLIAKVSGHSKQGMGLTLHIKGSASQIPTSFDPDKPNNNINPDGSSIKGQTSKENNIKLAHARAIQLAKKIKQRFPKIEIVIPSLSEIEDGTTPWTRDHQLALNKAYLASDLEAIDEIYAPFQKDQYVKVELKSTFIKTVQPHNLKMYAIASHPRFTHKTTQGRRFIHGPLVVSKKTYESLGDHLVFHSISERDQFLKSKGLEIAHTLIGKSERWFVVSPAEKEALMIENEEQKIAALYKLGMVHYKDEQTLQAILTQEYLDKNLYSYKLKESVARTNADPLMINVE